MCDEEFSDPKDVREIFLFLKLVKSFKSMKKY